MVQSSKKKAHVGCSCKQCKAGAGTEAGQIIHNQNERKLRRLAKVELSKAIKETKRELEDIDVLGQIGSPYTD
jgi:hypothetical protein